MVVEPSPQCVGREFVRQYYTLMNEAPDCLHRFYSGESCFIHSGIEWSGQEEKVASGQKEIHKRIQELNFKDCHTKIRQVDSQATISNGVVVQVTGELSNQGGPMRRFMQTFVLALKTPKQYYVSNDIFRYQDEIFHDYDDEVEPQNSIEAAQENGPTSDIVKNDEENSDYGSPVDHQSFSVAPVTSEMPEASHEEPILSSPTELQKVLPEQYQHDQSVKVDEPAGSQTEDLVKISVELPPSVESLAMVEKINKSSWANVVAVVPPMPIIDTNKQAPPSQQQKEEEDSFAFPAMPALEVNDSSGKVTKPTNRTSVEPMPRPPRHEEKERGDRRTNERFPDMHQIFVGNLPLDIADLQLKRFFNGYGKVLDVRVNRSAAGGKVPFGFVVFDSPDPVSKLLQLKRVEMDGHRLNVEEKKARNDRAGSNSRPGRGPRSGGRASSRPKDRENSGSRSDNRLAQGRKFRS